MNLNVKLDFNKQINILYMASNDSKIDFIDSCLNKLNFDKDINFKVAYENIDAKSNLLKLIQEKQTNIIVVNRENYELFEYLEAIIPSINPYLDLIFNDTKSYKGLELKILNSIKNIYKERQTLAKLKSKNLVDNAMINKMDNFLNGNFEFADLTDEKIDNLINLVKDEIQNTV